MGDQHKKIQKKKWDYEKHCHTDDGCLKRQRKGIARRDGHASDSHLHVINGQKCQCFTTLEGAFNCV